MGLVIYNWISNPVSTDELLYCIPVCAPYSSLMDYKFKYWIEFYFMFRVKILPGKSKKGKLIKEINEYFKQKATPVRWFEDYLDYVV